MSAFCVFLSVVQVYTELFFNYQLGCILNIYFLSFFNNIGLGLICELVCGTLYNLLMGLSQLLLLCSMLNNSSGFFILWPISHEVI